eukprot:2858412-Pyramimonas_sp.AAC.1
MPEHQTLLEPLPSSVLEKALRPQCVAACARRVWSDPRSFSLKYVLQRGVLPEIVDCKLPVDGKGTPPFQK